MAIEKILSELIMAVNRQAEATEANAKAGNALLAWYKENNVVNASGSQDALKLGESEKREHVNEETQPTASTTQNAAAEAGEAVDSDEPDAADEEVKAQETEDAPATEQPTKEDVLTEMKALRDRTGSLASVNKVLKNYKNKDNPEVPALNIGQIAPADYANLIAELKAA